MTRRLGTLAAVLAVLAGIYLVAWQTQPHASGGPPARPAGTTIAVTSASRACPPPGPGTGVARIAMVAIPGQAATAAGTAAAGTARLSAIPSAPAGSPTASAAGQSAGGNLGQGNQVTASAPGALTVTTAPASTQYGGTSVSVMGTMAEGFEAEEATASGMGTVSCAHPESDMWFVGAGQQAGAPTTRLYLMNPGNVAASVEITLLTDAGVQQGLSTPITVGPDQYVWENIGHFAHGSVVIGLHVQASSGQVAAAVWQGPASGSGGTWLPQAVAPAKQVVIPGLTTASSAARLFVAVPGAADAQVKVVALTAHGPFLPFGPTSQDAPAGASSSFSLAALGTSAEALVLTSNVPITAGVVVPGSGIGSFSAAAAPVTGQGVIAGNPASGKISVGLVLTAPAGGGTVRITVAGSGTGGGQPTSPQVVHVPGGRTVAVTVQPPPGKQPFAIVVTPRPGSGPVYAARVVTSGTGLSGAVTSILPVPSAPTQVTLPPTRDTYEAVFPGG